MDKQQQREERRLVHKLKEVQPGIDADRRKQGDATETEIVRRARKPKGLTRRRDQA